MTHTQTEPEWGPTCWDCGATNDPGASECWLCGRSDWHAPQRSPMPLKPGPPPTSGQGSGLVGLALALVALGATAIAPGVMFGLAVLILPAAIGAEFIARRRRNRGLPTSTTRKVAWIAVLTVLMPFLVGMALIIALLPICLLSSPQTFH